jgi:hypothetical protein
LPLPISVQSVREVARGDRLRAKPGFFQIIEAATERGDLHLAVPRDSVALVLERLTLGEQGWLTASSCRHRCRFRRSWPAVCSLHGHAPFDIMSREAEGRNPYVPLAVHGAPGPPTWP